MGGGLAYGRTPVADIYIATESGTAEVEGKPFIFIKNVTRVRAGHPALRQLGAFFAPVDDRVDYDVEKATAAPGEKRTAPPKAVVSPKPKA